MNPKGDITFRDVDPDTIFDLPTWFEMIKDHSVTPDDGMGYAERDGVCMEEKFAVLFGPKFNIFDRDVLVESGATHVRWFNK